MRTITAITVLAFPLLLLGGQEAVGYLGVSTHGLSEAMRIALNIDHGVIVERVHEDSPAEKAGVKVGDIITKIDDDLVNDYKTLKRAVAARPNERVSMTIYRRGKKLSKAFTLGEREASKLKLEMDIPDIPDFKITVNTEEIEQAIEEIKAELEKVKEELKQLKKQY
jgi:C-terminal processing protease CtpA/Prc